jgi:glycosyltransferase involved in cell wall biosynthesis
VLSSRQALEDLESFSPQGASKGRVVNFAAHLPPGVRNDDPAWLCPRYHLPERFIYLPNQFWAHKNHGLVLDALELLSRTRPEVAVVCTGNTSDSRNPHFFGELLARISARGLRERMIMLGLVEHDHVFHLMRQCLAVLQPSIFEGWSTTVEEVKSLGKRILVSDIPVHREQNPPGALFFDPRDAAALARRLEEAYDVCSPGPDREMEAAAARDLPARTQDFAQKFLAVIREAVG